MCGHTKIQGIWKKKGGILVLQKHDKYFKLQNSTLVCVCASDVLVIYQLYWIVNIYIYIYNLMAGEPIHMAFTYIYIYIYIYMCVCVCVCVCVWVSECVYMHNYNKLSYGYR